MGDFEKLEEVKPFEMSSNKDVKQLNAASKWKSRVLFSEPCKSNDWNKIIEKQVAILRVSLPFLTQRQIRGKALKICGIPSVMGNLPRSYSPWNLKKENFQLNYRPKYLKSPFLKKKLKKEHNEITDSKNIFPNEPHRRIKMEIKSPILTKPNSPELTISSSPLSKISQESGFHLLSNSTEKPDISSHVINDTEIISSSLSLDTYVEGSIMDKNVSETQESQNSDISDVRSLNVISPKNGAIDIIPARDVKSMYTEQSISSCYSCYVYQEPQTSETDSDRTESYLSFSDKRKKKTNLSMKSFKKLENSEIDYCVFTNDSSNLTNVMSPYSKRLSLSLNSTKSDICIIPRKKLMSQACSEFDKRSMSKDLLPYGNNHLNTSFNEVIPDETSLTEFLITPNDSFEDIEEIVKEKVNDILMILQVKEENNF